MKWHKEFPQLDLSSNDLLPDFAITALDSWSAITLSGDQSKPYLQGQVTCDVVSLDKSNFTFGSHCDAKGKVWSVFRLFYHHSDLAMFQPKELIEKELAELKKYAIFSRVELDQCSDVALGLMGTQSTDFIDSITTERGDVRPIEQGTAVKVDEQRWLLLLSQAAAIDILSTTEATKVSEELWTLLEIKSAFPILTQEQQLEHIPQALNLHALGGISFTKGCYTGQETVARAKYRGTNKRSLALLFGECYQELAANVELERAVGENWRGAGKIIAHYQFNDNKLLALVVLPNNLDHDTHFRVKGAPTSILNFSPLP
jgi:folate-binding protein YgfZ